MSEFEPHPMWGELSEVYAAFVAHPDEYDRAGFAIYAADDNGSVSGRQIDFVGPITFDGRNPYCHLEDAGYRSGLQAVSIINPDARIIASADEWDRLTDATAWPATSEKFSNGLAERLWLLSLDSGQDEELGTSEGFGWHALFASHCAILDEDSQGALSVTTYDTEALARQAWKELGEEFEAWEMEGIRDGLSDAMGACDGLFLIFDTAAHLNATPDRTEVSDHVYACATCRPHRYVMDY
jgi:hypothetical protein